MNLIMATHLAPNWLSTSRKSMWENIFFFKHSVRSSVFVLVLLLSLACHACEFRRKNRHIGDGGGRCRDNNSLTRSSCLLAVVGGRPRVCVLQAQSDVKREKKSELRARAAHTRAKLVWAATWVPRDHTHGHQVLRAQVSIGRRSSWIIHTHTLTIILQCFYLFYFFFFLGGRPTATGQ